MDTAKLHKVIKTVLMFNQDKILTPDMTMEDLGVDEFDELDLIIAIEEEFHIDLGGDGIEHVKTIGDLERLVATELGE